MGRDEQTNKKQNKQTQKTPSRFSYSHSLGSDVILPASSAGVGI
jgi:hypothetical protein